jgi:hypothetical protein
VHACIQLYTKVINIGKNIKKNPQLGEKTLSEIEEARRRIKEGDFCTEEEVREMLNQHER